MEITQGPSTYSTKIASQVLNSVPDFMEVGVKSVLQTIAPGYTSQVMVAGNYVIDLVTESGVENLATMLGRATLGSLGVRIDPAQVTGKSYFYGESGTGLDMRCDFISNSGYTTSWTGTSYAEYTTCGEYAEYTRPIMTLKNITSQPIVLKLSAIPEYASEGSTQLTTSTMIYVRNILSSLF